MKRDKIGYFWLRDIFGHWKGLHESFTKLYFIFFCQNYSCCGRNPAGGARGVKERFFCRSAVFFGENVAVRQRVKWATMARTGQLSARTWY